MVSAEQAKINQDLAAAKFRAAVGETVFTVQVLSGFINTARRLRSVAFQQKFIPPRLRQIAQLVPRMSFNDFRKLQVKIPEVIAFFER